MSDSYRRDPFAPLTIGAGTDEVVTRTHVPTTGGTVERGPGSVPEAIRTGTPTRTPVASAARDVEQIAELVSRPAAGVGVSA